jgi:hypothetical protein
MITGGFLRRAVPCATRGPRSNIKSAHHLLYAGGHAADYRKIVALGTVDVLRDLDFCPPHVYPEACQPILQIDRDAVIVFLGD